MSTSKRPSWFVPTPATPEHFDYPAVAQQAGIGLAQLAEIVLAFEIDYPSDLMLRELHVLRACNSVLAGRTSLDKMLADLRRGHSEAA